MGKGSAWEREVSKILSEWLTGNRTPPVLWRSTQSGGWASKNDSNHGDITHHSEEGKRLLDIFVIECKHYAKIDFWHWMSRKQNSTLSQWWTKLCEEAKEAGRLPMLIIKRNNYPPLIATSVRLPMPDGCPFISVGSLNESEPVAIFYRMDDFLDRLDITDIEETVAT